MYFFEKSEICVRLALEWTGIWVRYPCGVCLEGMRRGGFGCKWKGAGAFWAESHRVLRTLLRLRLRCPFCLANRLTALRAKRQRVLWALLRSHLLASLSILSGESSSTDSSDRIATCPLGTPPLTLFAALSILLSSSLTFAE